MDIKYLLARCQAWLDETGCRAGTLSTYVFSEGSFLARLQTGHVGITPERYTKALRWLDANPASTWRALHPRGRPRGITKGAGDGKSQGQGHRAGAG